MTAWIWNDFLLKCNLNTYFIIPEKENSYFLFAFNFSIFCYWVKGSPVNVCGSVSITDVNCFSCLISFPSLSPKWNLYNTISNRKKYNASHRYPKLSGASFLHHELLSSRHLQIPCCSVIAHSSTLLYCKCTCQRTRHSFLKTVRKTYKNSWENVPDGR